MLCYTHMCVKIPSTITVDLGPLQRDSFTEHLYDDREKTGKSLEFWLTRTLGAHEMVPSCELNIGYFFTRTSLVAPTVTSLPARQETWGRSLGGKDPLEKDMSILVSLPREFMDRGAWRAIVHGVAKRQTWLSSQYCHFSPGKRLTLSYLLETHLVPHSASLCPIVWSPNLAVLLQQDPGTRFSSFLLFSQPLLIWRTYSHCPQPKSFILFFFFIRPLSAILMNPK